MRTRRMRLLRMRMMKRKKRRRKTISAGAVAGVAKKLNQFGQSNLSQKNLAASHAEAINHSYLRMASTKERGGSRHYKFWGRLFAYLHAATRDRLVAKQATGQCTKGNW